LKAEDVAGSIANSKHFKRNSRRGTLRGFVCWASLGYLAIVIIIVPLMSYAGDRWWPATVLLFSPRWIVALPLIILLPMAIFFNRRQLISLVIAALVVFGPLMGFCIPSGMAGSATSRPLRVLTCNIQNGDYSNVMLKYVIEEFNVDIVALQECPAEIKLKLTSDWNFVKDGELAVFSRYPLRMLSSIKALHPPHKWPRESLLQCIIQAPGGDIVFSTVHLPSPRYGLTSILDRHTFLNLSRRYLLEQETVNRQQTSQQVERLASAARLPVLVAGDFNMPPDSSIYRRYWNRYSNAFTNRGFGYGFTAHETIRGLEIGARLDHILAGEGLTPRRCRLGPDVGSDHLPLFAEIDRIAANQ
jgi:vancomycin resistance protein VanJ